MAERSSNTELPGPKPPPKAPAASTRLVPTSTSTTVAQTPPSKITSYFTQSQLALALAMTRSKPEALSTNEYIDHLRANIQTGKERIGAAHRHIDTPEFWREQYTKIYKEKRTFEDKVHRLEEELRLRGDECTDEERGLISSRKRPRSAEDSSPCIFDIEGDPSLSPDQDVLLRMSSFVLRISRSRNSLKKATKESTSLSHIEEQFKISVQLLALLESALPACLIPLWSLRCGDDAQTLLLLQQLIHQLSLSVHASFEALDTLCQTILGRQKRFEIVYHLVTFFHKGLHHLRTICNIQAENNISMVDDRGSRNKRARTEGDYAVNKYLTAMLISVAQMEWKAGQAGHSEILEGMLFAILDHTGRLVSNAAFKEHVATSNLPGNITKGESEIPPTAAKLETQCIVPILHAALGKTPARKELIARVLAETPLNADMQRRPHASPEHTRELLHKAKKMIQSSLVKSAVGGEALQSLKTPAPPDNWQYTPEVVASVDRYGPEWLLESVWALVGWELAVQETEI